jgi:hypothetical protein
MNCKNINTHQAIELSNALRDAVAGSKENNKPYAIVYSDKMNAAIAMPDEEDLGASMGYSCVMVVGG